MLDGDTLAESDDDCHETSETADEDGASKEMFDRKIVDAVDAVPDAGERASKIPLRVTKSLIDDDIVDEETEEEEEEVIASKKSRDIDVVPSMIEIGTGISDDIDDHARPATVDDKLVQNDGGIDVSRDVLTTHDPQNTPLHLALIQHERVDFLMSMLNEHPEYAQIPNKSRDLPLHYAAMDKRIIDDRVLDLLIRLYPRACRSLNSIRSLPLHLHCMIGAPNLSFVKKNLKVHPAAAMVQSELTVAYHADDPNDGSSSSAAGFGTAFCLGFDFVETVQYTLLSGLGTRGRGRRSSKQTVVEVGWSPLHLAVYNGAPVEVVEELLRVAPRCASLRTSQNRTALDCGASILRIVESEGSVAAAGRSACEKRMFDVLRTNAAHTERAVELLTRATKESR